MNKNNAPNVGDRIVVEDIKYALATVQKRLYNEKTGETLLVLDWGIHGTSKVWLHDENVTWYRYDTMN